MPSTWISAKRMIRHFEGCRVLKSGVHHVSRVHFLRHGHQLGPVRYLSGYLNQRFNDGGLVLHTHAWSINKFPEQSLASSSLQLSHHHRLESAKETIAMLFFYINSISTVIFLSYLEFSGNPEALLEHWEQHLYDSLQLLRGPPGEIETDRPLKHTTSHYSALIEDEFRVLILEPGQPKDPIKIRLFTCKHSNQPRYEALSYARGDPAKAFMIECNGKGFGIAANLEGVLRSLRHPLVWRAPWVDAICIDQDDYHGRGHQVGLMKDIFSRARRVLIWLGPETDQFYQLFSGIPFNRWLSYDPSGVIISDMMGKRPYFDFAKEGYEINSGQMRTLIHLMERPCFSRLWVLQEVAYGQEVVLCLGSRYVGWEYLASLIYHLDERGDIIDEFTETAAAGAQSVMEIQMFRSELAESLLSVMLATHSGRCSDDRDKVFAVLNLSRDLKVKQEDFILPDYTVSVEEIFRRLAVWSLLHHEPDQILSCTSRSPGQPVEKLLDLPSWVPDWTRIDNDKPFTRFESCHLSERAPLLQPAPTPKPSIQGHHLNLVTIKVDELQQVGGPPRFRKTSFRKPWTERTYEAMMRTQSWISECEALAFTTIAAPGHNDRQLLERSWRTLVANMTSEGEIAPVDFPDDFQVYKEVLATCTNTNKWTPLTGSTIASVARVEAALHTWSSRRRFALTAGGRMALVTNASQAGDLVMLVADCRVPYILRQKDDGTFAILGEAYIEEVMEPSFVKRINAEFKNWMRLIRELDGAVSASLQDCTCAGPEFLKWVLKAYHSRCR